MDFFTTASLDICYQKAEKRVKEATKNDDST